MKPHFKSIVAQIVFTTLIFTSFFLAAQNKVVREIDAFDQVEVSDDLKVIFRKADTEKITIISDGIGYDKIVTESSGRVLKIKVKTGVFKSTDVQIEVDYVKVRSVSASNKADIKFQEVVEGDELSLKSTGNAVINMEIDISALKASLSNGGRIEVSGKADLQEVDANLAAKYNAFELESKNGFVKSNTNSDVVVWVTGKLDASAGSKAELKYRGKPEEVVSSTSLGGKITGDL